MELSENKGPLRNQIRDYQVEYQKGSDAAFNPNYGSTNVNRSAGESNVFNCINIGYSLYTEPTPRPIYSNCRILPKQRKGSKGSYFC